MLDEADAALAITGSTVVWRLFLSGTQILEKSTTAGNIAIIDKSATDDGIRVTIAPGDTSALAAPALYDHECRVTDPSADQNVFFVGRVNLRPSLTL